MEIIPAIDIIGGNCVRLTRGDYAQQTIYNSNPLEVAKAFADAGFRRLHLVDLDGAKAGKIVNGAVLESIASNTDLLIDFGGGVKTRDDVSTILNTGASMVTIGSLAVKNPGLLAAFAAEFGTDKFFIGVDVLAEKVRVSGWLENSGIHIYDLLESLYAIGFKHFFCTDIEKDGAMQGPSVNLYKKIMKRFPGIALTASGGVTTVEDIDILASAGCSGAIIGKAFYEGSITFDQLKNQFN